ncbi:putative lipoprotein [Hyphomonas neptunium ATCC 15444]|uniref:Putative lipoprotein n=2 Tax=Hyphomonas TaxID=85 RepID=Q0C458_HYPNA|nr:MULTISPECIES: alpha/beta fold hydrolase [Hyphomonas]ABI76476.1 putative lipoprotein [Hyphomonas neptunium ATCC 15444]KCZ96303.1 putative lipoprotein [Hyphomonas hirschiana VP5]
MKTFAAISLAATALLAACTTPVALAPEATLTGRYADPAAIDPDHPPALMELNFESGGARLNGLIYLADGAGPHPTVVLLHGYPGNEKNLDLAQAMRREGFNVMFFHYRGAWGSDGNFSFSNVVEDVGAATGFLRANAGTYRTDPEKLILIGHSMGGFAAFSAAANDSRVACAAGLAPADFGVLGAAMAANPEVLEGFSGYTDTLSMLKGFSGEAAIVELFSNAAAFDLRAKAPELAGKSVLIVAGDADESTPLEGMIQPLMDAYEAAPDIETTLVVLPGDHSFSWSRAALIDTVIGWADGCR